MSEERREYYRELGVISGLVRRRRRLRSEYFSCMAQIRGLLREKGRLEAHLSVLSPVRQLREWTDTQGRIIKIDREREQLLTRMRDLRETEAEVEADLERAREEFHKKKKPPKRFWRVQKAREYFAHEPGKETPVPFAEYRVWVFTQEPERWPEKVLAAELNGLEYALSVSGARTHIAWAKSVYHEQSYESEEVDPDEVNVPLDEVQYYVVFYHKPRKGGKIELKPDTIKKAFERSGEKTRHFESVKQLTLEEWAKKERPKP